MREGLLVLVAIAVVGLSPSVAIVALRQRDARRFASHLVAYRLRLSGAATTAQIEAFLEGLSGLRPNRWHRAVRVHGVVWEIVATETGTEHVLLVERERQDIVLSALRAALPTIGVEPDPSYHPPQPNLAVTLSTSHIDRPLRTDRPEVVATAVLAALQPVASGEELVIQYVMVPLGYYQPPVPWKGVSPTAPAATSTDARPSVPKAMREKFSRPQFGLAIRLGVRSARPQRRQQLLGRLLAAFHAASSEHAHLRRRLGTSGQAIRAMTGRRVPLVDYPSRPSSRELVGLLALPGEDTNLPGVSLGSSRRLPPPPEVERSGRVLADATYPGMERPLAISVRSGLTHTHVIGPSGVGKSTLLLNLYAQDVAAGRGVVLVDPKTDLARDALDVTPPDRDVVVIDPTDEAPVGIDLFAGGAEDPELVAERLTSVLHRIYAEFWGPRTDDILRHALLSLVRFPGATFTELPRLLLDPLYRQRVVATLDDPIALEPFWAWYESMKESERTAAIGPILNKLRAVVARPRLRRVLGQAGATVDFDDVLATGKIVIAPLSAGTLGDDAAQLLGSLLVAQLWAAIQRRVRLPQAERPPVFVYLDEFQAVANLSSPLPEVLAQARAMGVGFVLAHQHLDQLARDTREAVMANCRTRVVFQTSAADAKRLAPEFAPQLAAGDLQGLAPFEVAMRLAAADGVAPPVTGRTRPAPDPLGHGEALRERSRQRYGRPVAEIDAELRARYATPGGEGSVGRKRRSA